MPEVAVDLRDVWVFYNGLPALEEVNLEIQTGKYVGVLGPNGAGKSTLLKVILGLLVPARGQVRVYGEIPQKLRHRGEVVGYLPQRPLNNPHFPVSVLDVVLMGRYGRVGLVRRPSLRDREIALMNLERVGIPHLAGRTIGEVSGGEQQRVFIARALCVEPRLLVLDEPTVSLDACAQDEVFEMVNRLKDELQLTVLMVSHDIGGVARHVDDIVCINRRIHVHQAPPIGRLGLESAFGCSVEYLFHGEIPHRVVKVHDD
ncbi:MAG: metal ABC transporter ATP-binding protein [Syntrophales bacterium]|nr:metal ABC transporter ATP-binding protein [Syntrophales bacterium]MDD5640819.1 metal ABC transporter ATP-binding protein [Syntrophales bacterium]